MARKKKIQFKLNPEWMLKEPLDFEYNKYTLLDYLQKCDKGFEKLQIYPDFVELSLHLANLQSLVKENTLLLTDKKFESCDDEILLKELYPKKPRELSDEEEEELQKTIRYSGGKLFDAFNIAKSIWNLAYDNVEILVKKNKNNIISSIGYIFFYKKSEDKVIVWEYQMKRKKKDHSFSKTNLKIIYDDVPSKLSITNIIDTFSTWNQDDNFKQLPMFEVRCSQDFPMNETFIPIIKRKLASYILQTATMDNLKNFDSKK